MSNTISLKPFSLGDQQAFARLSHDRNPVHLDAKFARRTMFGQPIVHGMNLALHVLEAVAAFNAVAYTKMTARFRRAVFLDEDLDLRLTETEKGVVAVLVSDGAELCHIQLSEPASLEAKAWQPTTHQSLEVPREFSIDEMIGLTGQVALSQDPGEIEALYPAASALYGTNRIAQLLGITYAIGMEVPGMHSMFATLTATLKDDVDPHLNYAVDRVTPKLSRVKLVFESKALEAVAETFVRPQIRPIGFEACKQAVTPGEFKGRTALIVGGSRGLGLLTAYLLGAGGARVVLTYRSGAEEARRAVSELEAKGIEASSVQLDVADPGAAFSELEGKINTFTDLFYFATPHIFVRKKKLFEAHLLEGFMKSYTSDFLAVLERFKGVSTGEISVFFPSSDALNNPLADLAEYYVAKVAGEAVCEMLNRYDERVNVITTRLPRLPTDQTATLMDVEAGDPVVWLLGICRKMVDASLEKVL